MPINLSLTTIEPSIDDVIHYLKLAPLKAGQAEHAQINLYLVIKNNGASNVVINTIELSVSSPVAASQSGDVNMTLGPGIERRLGAAHGFRLQSAPDVQSENQDQLSGPRTSGLHQATGGSPESDTRPWLPLLGRDA